MSTVPALAAPTARQPLARTTIERREPGPGDVVIDIEYTGICHTDIHQVRDDWGPGTYPMVPGHEIAGVVSAVGERVTRFAVGDRVGVGCMVDSCRECEYCRAGDEQYCTGGLVLTYNSTGKDGLTTHGGYATRIVVSEDFVLRIPEGLALDAAAPLLCAGITVYAPLKRWLAPGRHRVAVVGLGGLGHVAVKLAKAMGAEVTVISRTLSKKEEAERLGAGAYHASQDPSTFEALSGSFDLIINTVSSALDLGGYLGLLRPTGVMANVGLPADSSTLHLGSVIGGSKVLAGSMIGGIAATQEMLDFCAGNQIAADIETIGVDHVNTAYERILKGDVRFRFVIDIASFGHMKDSH